MPPLTPLLRPSKYYEEFDPSIFESSMAVFVTAIVVSLSLLAVGVIAAGGVHVNVAVESPVHPSDVICSQHGSGGDGVGDVNGPNCDVPATTAQFVTGWRTVSAWAPLTFAAVYAVWFGTSVGLHLFTSLFVDEPNFGDTLSIAGWGIVPLALEAFITLLLVLLAFARFPMSAPLSELVAQVRSLLVTFGGSVRFLVSASVAAWQGYVWTLGLKRVHGFSLPRATVAAGAVAVALFALAAL